MSEDLPEIDIDGIEALLNYKKKKNVSREHDMKKGNAGFVSLEIGKIL